MIAISSILIGLTILFGQCFSLNLNSVESFFLSKRLNGIKYQTEQKFSSLSKIENANRLVLIFPGAGGRDQFSDELEETLQSYLNEEKESTMDLPFGLSFGSKANVESTKVTTIDWQEFRGSILSAAFDSEAVGEAIGGLIQDDYTRYSYIQVIGISVGAFAANACASLLCRKRSIDSLDKPYIRLTLLDPFTGRGVAGNGYGDKNFGTKVDYSEQYMNTDDPVPTTNEPLSNCATFDVTSAVERDDFVLPENETMHCWPLVYYARYAYKDNAGRIVNHGENGCPERSDVVIL